ncbi:tetratricopeptide repeat-containing protein [Marinobacter xestospongiae]|uniref:Tetratricopeptide repeat-containing protein n=1 Tax=Marinobacter xestospongiae TaxID=994319 RepID=A0ABU3W2T8_9GAMM|nr:tetratricopeptide repeat-containing protein [Marinobacter xestospongiae]MDV2080858.1 tetratricopeptide repeat-containing protein [Marinobacter xestospongiae]
MRVPDGIEELSVSVDDVPLGPYPPLGFLPVAEAALGNGDYYGLYWPIGRENQSPVVCDMFHDEHALKPCFSSVERFIEWLKVSEWERGDNEIADEMSPALLFAEARVCYSGSDVKGAVELLKKACDVLPEVSEYWHALSTQAKRLSEVELSAQSALNALNSNWVFGLPSQGVIRMLRSPSVREAIPNDPLIQRIDELELGFGGVKENPAYSVIYECVQEYFKREQFIEGLVLYQNYAYMMYSETLSFQERHDFNLQDWQSEYTGLCLQYLGDNRTISDQMVMA